jgi:hypothetical protein
MAGVWVWGREPPAFSIGYETPCGPEDSGFTVLFDDAPDPDDVAELGHPLIRDVHLGCLLEEHPELAGGFEVARRFGAADLDDDGGWVGRVVRWALRPV